MKKREETTTPTQAAPEVKVRRPRRTPEQVLQAALDNLEGLRRKLEQRVTEAQAAMNEAEMDYNEAVQRLGAFDAARKGN